MTDTTQAAGLIERLKAQAAAHRYMAETDSAQLIDEAVAALAAQAVPAGWKLLPEEPTEEMVQEVYLNSSVTGLDDFAIKDIWDAMLAASPAPAEAQAVPAGWKLVPCDPPKEMMEAMPSLPAVNPVTDRSLADAGWSMTAIMNRKRYLAALAASPAPAEAKEEPTIPDSFFRGMDADYRKEAWRIRSKIKNGLATPQPQAAQPVAEIIVSPCGGAHLHRLPGWNLKAGSRTAIYTAAPALTEDKARLDYLQSVGATIELVGPTLKFRIGGRIEAVSPDLREAIDKARALRSTQGGE